MMSSVSYPIWTSAYGVWCMVSRNAQAAFRSHIHKFFCLSRYRTPPILRSIDFHHPSQTQHQVMCRTTGRKRSSVVLKRESLGIGAKPTEPADELLLVPRCDCSQKLLSIVKNADGAANENENNPPPCLGRVNNASMRFKMFLEYAGENDQMLAYERFERIFHPSCVFVMGKGQERSLSFFKFCVGGLISLGCRTPKVEICLVDQRRFRARFKVYLSGRNVVTPDRLMTIDDAGKVIRNEPYAEDDKCPFVKCLNIAAKA